MGTKNIKLSSAVGREILLLHDDDEESGNVACFVANSFNMLASYMKETLCSNADQNIRVIHGVLTKANFIPKNIHNKTAYVIAEDPLCYNNISIDEASVSTTEGISDDITQLFKYGGVFEIPVKIENIYILYGYELSVYPIIDEDDVDEETISTCIKIASNCRK